MLLCSVELLLDLVVLIGKFVLAVLGTVFWIRGDCCFSFLSTERSKMICDMNGIVKNEN